MAMTREIHDRDTFPGDVTRHCAVQLGGRCSDRGFWIRSVTLPAQGSLNIISFFLSPPPPPPPLPHAMASTFPDYYAFLNVPQTATTEEIRTAYKKESLR